MITGPTPLPPVASPVATAALLLLFLLPTSADAQVRKVTLEELTRTSTAVLVGEAEAPRSFWNEKRTQILTEVKIRVDESVKGDLGSETVITIPGGRVGNTMYEVSDMPVFEDGEQVLVFLWRHPSGRQLVTAGHQGKLAIAIDPASEKAVLRGAAPLLVDAEALGKAAAAPAPLSAHGDAALAEVLERIRSYVTD